MKWVIAMVLGAGALFAAGCSEREQPRAPVRDPQKQRKGDDIKPPTGTVRALPPHAIRSDGVGPYTLGERVATLLQQLPSGPRITRFEIPGVVRTGVIRAEDDTVLIGGETNGVATFVAVIGSEVARTEAGIKVGSQIDDLVATLGPLADDPERARDPRLAMPRALRNVRAVIDGSRIVAFVVTAEPEVRTKHDPADCPRPVPSVSARRTFGACLSGTGELVHVENDEVMIHAPDSEKLVAGTRIPNLVFVAPLRNISERRDELVAVTRAGDNQHRTWSLAVFRLENRQLVRVLDSEQLYELSSAQTRWIGSELHNVDLYLELTSRSDGIEVGGLLTSKRGDKIRDVAVISSVLVPRRGGKAASADAQDAGVDGPLPDSNPKPGAGGSRP